MTNKIILFTSLLLLITQINFAQVPTSAAPQNTEKLHGPMDPNNIPKSGLVKGNVIDAQTGEGVEYATVAFYNLRLKKITAGGITDEKGNFSIENIPMGQYEMKIEFIGYEPYVIKNLKITNEESEHIFNNLKISSKATDLNEVNITAERAVIVNKIDRKVVSVDKDLVSAGGTAIDVLENVPSIEVDTEGNVSLRGSQNLTILIDGRPSGLSAESTGALLEAIPSESIESIEIITNPSAKYDPEGVSGILNVILKKNKFSGFNGQVNSGLGTDGSYSIGANLNYRTSKMNLSATYGFRQFKQPMSGASEKTVLVNDTIKLFNDTNESDRTGGGHNFSLNADFFLNPKNVWSFGARGGSRNMRRTQESIYQNYYEPFEITDYYLNDITSSNLGFSYDLNTNYRKTLSSKDHYVEAEIAYSNYDSEMDQNRTTSAISDLYYPDGFTPNDLSENTLSTNQVSTFRLDYLQTFEHSKLELGAKSTLKKSNNDYIAGQLDENEHIIPNENLTNNFIYNENIHALYTQFAGEIGKFSYQTGLRAEYADIQSELVTTNDSYPNEYFSLYPSLFLLQKINADNEINFNYSRRVNRPNSRQLNPFGNTSDPYNIRKGNPDLSPEYVNAIEVAYTRYINKSMLNATLYYRYVTDVIETINLVDDFGVSTITYQNIGSRESYGGEVTYSGQFYKWWSMNAGLNFYQLTYNSGESTELSNAGFTWNLKASNNFKINSNLSAQLSGRYDAARVTSQGSMDARFAVDAGLKQDFLKKKASVNLRVRDIFNTRKFAYTSTGSNFTQFTERFPTTRVLQISVSYKFGKLNKDKNREKRSEQESGEDLGDFEI
ncbi:MAG: TonB-dependent receptor [Bacteroidales bacterium]|nr:TonB-dependent receptor [Bacteroidales bacterium]